MNYIYYFNLIITIIYLNFLKFNNCYQIDIDAIIREKFNNVNTCRNARCSLQFSHDGKRILLNDSINLVEFNIEILSRRNNSLILNIKTASNDNSVNVRKYLPDECSIDRFENTFECIFPFETQNVAKRSTDLSNVRIKFSRNIFSFKALEKQVQANMLVGKLLINNELFFQQNLPNLVVSMKATRDSSSEKLFSIDAKTLEIFTKQVLDSSLIKTHYFRINIHQKDMLFEEPLTSCSLVIHVVNAEINTPPKFKFDTYEAQVFENNAPDTLLIRVEAIDEDYGENARITYHLSNKNPNANNINEPSFLSNPFQIKSDTGEIFARRILNREEKDSYVLNVLAIDNGSNRLSSSAKVFVRVLAQKDNAPKFEQAAYNLTVSENADFLKRPVVLTVKAIEFTESFSSNNSNIIETNNLMYSLHGSLNDLNTFEIEPKTGQIHLVSKLNYELKSLYQLSVIARDFGQPPCSTHALLTINIEDMNQNPPVFTAPFYEFILFENVPLGYNVGKVYAFDSDSKMHDNSNIKYSLLNNNEEALPFDIDYKNGTIYTIKKLNRKLYSNSLEFYVMALDTRRNNLNMNLNSSVKVKIKILDINDNVPEFSKQTYTLNISEEAAPVGLPLLTLNVINKDLNSELVYSIESGNENEMFSLVKQENNRAFFTLKRSNLNYKKKSNYNLEIKVMDTYGLYSISNLYINVLPSKNLSPRFTKDLYSFKIKENAPVGSLVGSISASFYQTEIAVVSYKLIVNTETDRTSLINTADFRLDEQTGQLFVSNLLDREKLSSVTLYVTACDQEKPYRADHAIIQIEILDINDNRPVFTRNFYKADIYENTNIDAYLLRIEANDADSGENGIVRYKLDFNDESLNHEEIQIDEKSGVIRLKKKEPQFSQLNVTVIAYDLGEPSLSSKSFIILKNMFSQDNPPHFDVNPLVFYLVENQPVGTVIGEIKARDTDNDYSTSNIVYKILDKSGNDLFELKQFGKFNTVFLTTKFIADYETSEKSYAFQIRAYSLFSYSDCTVNIILRNSNDNAPVVKSPFTIIFNNYKNYFLTEQTARVPIQNLDITSNLTYKLVDSIGKQLVYLNPKTGQITLKSILNSNNQINVSFQISVNDGSHEVRATCHLVVLMLSDNLIAESVTLNFLNVDIDTFLNYLYENFTNSMIKTLPAMVPNIKQSNIHLFGLKNNSAGINVSLAVSYDYEKDIFMPASVLKQIVFSNNELIKQDLKIHKMSIYEDTSCAIEPCLNFQKCITSVKFAEASSAYIETNNIQFRSIYVKHDFSCSCPIGFTGTNVSLMCDLEINLCYSNPCGQNGICVSLESSFRCICDPNFTGRMCEYNMKNTKCCELEAVNVGKTLETKNKTKISINDCVTAKPSIYDFYSIELSNNRVCKGDSICKNLILGGVLCDKCAINSNDEEKTYYNRFCELRAKHFPDNSQAFLVFEGIKNRLRFKIKLDFATVKSNGYLYYNGRLDRDLNTQTGLDFIQLEIRNDILVFSYSLGDLFTNEITLNEISVTDGKWRTVTVEYVNRNVTLSLDNDNLDHVDACEFARNKIHSQKNTDECLRVNSYYVLPKKCENQIETCFRYFDLNGPLNVGRNSLNQNNYEGCISDLYLNDKMVNMKEDALVDYKTINGCKPKVNNCAKNQNCVNCKHIWSDIFKCSNYKNQNEEYGLSGIGYLVMENDLKKIDSIEIDIQFTVKFSFYSSSLLIKHINLLHLKFSNMLESYIELYLNFDSMTKTLNLVNSKNEILVSVRKNDHLTNDAYWNLIQFKILPDGFALIKLNELFEQKSSQRVIESDSINDSYLSWYIGGYPNAILNEESFTGCIKDIRKNGIYLNPIEKVNITKGCPNPKTSSVVSQTSHTCGINSPCYNNGTCSVVDASLGTINCTCTNGFKGDFCQYKNKLNMKLLDAGNNCPAKWWGKESGICGPCECDESKNFSPDCDKSTGVCQCKSKFYKTKEDRCVPCDCYLEGSTSLQCEPITGQCPCLKGAGITGRRCDQCVAPLAEMTSKGNECRQLSSSECPKAFSYNIWWPRTSFNRKANASCPKGSIGIAYRTCNENTGWLGDVDLSGCSTIKVIDTQLLKWSQDLSANKSQLNSYQAFKIVEDLYRITIETESDENNERDNLLMDDQLNAEMKNVHFSTSTNTLYAFDLLLIKNLTQKILQYEIDNAPEFLYIQDKYFLSNIISTLNLMLSKKYEIKFYQLSKREMLHTNITSSSESFLTDLLIQLDTYLKLIIEHQQEYSLSENEIQLAYPNIQMFLKTMQGQSFSEALLNIKFKLLQSDTQIEANHKLVYISLNGPSINFPNELVTISQNNKSKKLIQPFRYSNFQVASSILILSSVQQTALPYSNSTYNYQIANKEDSKSFYVVIDFVLTNNYESLYDSTVNIINYINIKVSKADYKCVYLNKELKAWSTYGAKLISYDVQTNTVKCSYDHFSIYAVVTPSGNFVRSASATPVQFTLAFYILAPVGFFFITITILCLSFLRRFKTPLTVIYINLCLNVFFLQLIFFVGINGNASHITCKFVSILQHYFHLSSYLWLFIISLHLYRMLTELRDINKVGTCSPVFYYVIAYVTPTLIVSLTLGIKQDIYTNYDNIYAQYNSIYCWLNLNNSNEIFIVFLLPIAIIVLAFLILCLMSFKERKQSTFKQTDLGLVYHSLISSLVLLPFKCLITVFLLKFLIDQINSNEIDSSNMYQYLYISFTIVYSILIFLVFVLLNKFTKNQLIKSWSSFKNSNPLLNESLNASKSKLTNKIEYSNEQFTNFAAVNNKIVNNNNANVNGLMHKSSIIVKNENNLYQMNIDRNNGQFILDYHDFQNHTNSISTTTTSGTMENTDDINSQDSNEYLKSGIAIGVSSTITTSNGYLSHLANTTNTESTTNESEFNYDFNRPHLMQQIYKNNMEIRECDVVDVEKILKARNNLQQQPAEQFKYAVNQMIDTPNKYYNDTINSDQQQPMVLTAPSQQLMQQPIVSHQQQSLFWPSTIAECDTSFLEGSIVYTPSKLPFVKNNTNIANMVPPDLLTCSNGSNQLQQPKQFKNNSYNSNGSSNTVSNNSNGNTVFATSNSSLLNLNNNDGVNAFDAVYQTNLIKPNFNYINNNMNNNSCPVFTHTGSPNTSDNDSNNETRV